IVDSYRRQTWSQLQRTIIESQVATTDVLSTPHGRGLLTRQLAQEIEDIDRVVGFLYAQTQLVAPFVRLQWVETVSTPGRLSDLSDLSALPGWLDVERTLRVQLQSLVDWIVGRFADHPDALAFANDLLRMVFMLSSHPALRQALSVEAVDGQQATVDERVTIQIPRDRVAIGVHALLFDADESSRPTARGVVTDIGDNVATIRVVSTSTGGAIRPRRARLLEPNRGPAVTTAGGGTQFVSVGTKFR
ncbi:MAG: hypothetical protein AAFV29_14485, partial [Myxococcota bacterium]